MIVAYYAHRLDNITILSEVSVIYCSSLYTSNCGGNTRLTTSGNDYVAYNNAFLMLFVLPRDCRASGMFAVHNVMSCPGLVRKLVFGFYKRVKASQNSIVQAIMCI